MKTRKKSSQGTSEPDAEKLLFPMWALSGEGPPPPRVGAFLDRPLAFIGAWEPLSFRSRAGYAYADEEEFLLEEEFSDQALDRYAALGASGIVLPYAKGFGLQATKEELDLEKDVIRRAHARGLKAGAYIRVDALIPELVKRDCPEVGEWLATGMGGRRSTYTAQQTFRQRVCYSHLGAVRWLEKLLTYGVKELGADYLHLDGFSVTYHPWDTCRCPRCLETYRGWLQQRFADPLLRRRIFGIADFDEIEFPEFRPHAPLPTVLTSADMQAWYLFQWERQVAFVRHIRRFIRRLSPETALTANPGWGRVANAPRIIAQHVEALLPWLDMVLIEDVLHLDFLNGSICSRIGVFKTAQEYDLPVGHYHWMADAKKIEASLALSIAANGGNVSCLGFSFRYLPHYSLGQEEKRRMAHWAEAHQALLGSTRPFGDIALLRHFPSLAWNGRHPWHAAMHMEQVLVHMRVPWRLFDSVSHDTLAQVQTLVLPDMESLSNDDLALLRDWVRGGGRLFFTGRTGTHDEFRRRRPRPAILSWFPEFDRPRSAEDWFSWCKEDFSESEEQGDRLKEEPWVRPFGEGRLGYWPQIVGSNACCLVNSWLKPENWALPSEAPAMEKFLRGLHGPFRFEVDGPASLLTNTAIHKETGEILLHLIQVDTDAAPPDLTIRGVEGRARVFSPDAAPPVLEHRDGHLRLSGLNRYAIVVFS